MRSAKRRWQLLLKLGSILVAASVMPRSPLVEPIHAASAAMRLKVDLSERRLYVIEGGEVVRTYGVAIGMPRYPTPTGHFWTGRIDWNPAWNPPDSPWARNKRPRAPGEPGNPMQGVKIYFREPTYFIHGTNNPGSIGRAASHGCLRMTEGDAISLARRISKRGSVSLVIQH